MIEKYVKAVKSGRTLSLYESPVQFKPEPSRADYRRGSMVRYFVQKRSDRRTITEISESQYRTVTAVYKGIDQSKYERFSLNWKISGPRYDIYNKEIPVQMGVEDTNRRVIERYEESYPGIGRILDDPLQFWQGYDDPDSRDNRRAPGLPGGIPR